MADRGGQGLGALFETETRETNVDTFLILELPFLVVFKGILYLEGSFFLFGGWLVVEIGIDVSWDCLRARGLVLGVTSLEGGVELGLEVVQGFHFGLEFKDKIEEILVVRHSLWWGSIVWGITTFLNLNSCFFIWPIVASSLLWFIGYLPLIGSFLLGAGDLRVGIMSGYSFQSMYRAQLLLFCAVVYTFPLDRVIVLILRCHFLIIWIIRK